MIAREEMGDLEVQTNLPNVEPKILRQCIACTSATRNLNELLCDKCKRTIAYMKKKARKTEWGLFERDGSGITYE